MLETQDRFGKKVTALLPLQVLEPEAKAVPHQDPEPRGRAEVDARAGRGVHGPLGHAATSRARAFVEIEHRGKIMQSFWTEPGATQQPVKQAVTEAMRGGFTLRVTMVRENRAYLTSPQVDVPWTNKKLTVNWEHFVSKLEPGQKETWTAVISGPGCQEGRGRNGGHPLRPVAGRLSAAQLAGRLRRLPPGLQPR